MASASADLSPALLRIVLVRHGETTANKAGIIQGQSFDPSFCLTELGVAQARATGTFLRDHKWWKIFSSDLPRASETTNLLITMTKSTTPPVVYSSLIREMGLGIREGSHREETVGALLEKFVEAHDKEVEAPKAETKAEVVSRAEDFLQMLARTAVGERTEENYETPWEALVVSHGGFILTLLKSVCKFGKVITKINNASITTIDVSLTRRQEKRERGNAGKVRIAYTPVEINFTGHLEEADNTLMSSSAW